jgi:hypothetical protein
VQCHEADTGLIAQCYTVAGMAFLRESVEQHRGTIPGRVRVVARVLRVGGGRSGDDVRAGALERGGPRRGGVEPSSEADLAPRGR